MAFNGVCRVLPAKLSTCSVLKLYSSNSCSKRYFALSAKALSHGIYHAQPSKASSFHGRSKLPAYFLCRNFSVATQSNKEIVQFKLSDIGEGISEVTIKEWFVNVGDKVNQFDSICEVQSDKASVTITSRFDGVITKIHYEVDGTAKVGQPLVDIEIEADDDAILERIDQVTDQDANKRLSAENVPHDQPEWTSYKKSLATPAVRRIAQENNIRMNEINGTGKDGRVLKEDIIKFLETKDSSRTSGGLGPNAFEAEKVLIQRDIKTVSTPPLAAALTANVLKDRTESIIGVQKAMVKTMTQALKIPHFALSDEVDMTSMVKLRPTLKALGEKRDVPISYMPFFVKAASLALKAFPVLNSSVSDACDAITYKSAHNIGVAIDTSSGLIVPNIKNVEELTVIEIAHELNRLQELGRSGKLSSNELSGGTFTLSNFGSIGGDFGIPVILPPQVVIGAIGKIKLIPMFDSSGQVVKAHIMKVVWSADHRIIDGATMCRFSNHWKALLENLPVMLMDMK